MVIYGILVLFTFDDWSRSEKLSLLESCIGLAGFGAGAAALFYAGSQIAERIGEPRLSMIDLQVIELFMIGQEATSDVPLIVENTGQVIPSWWRLSVSVPKSIAIEDADVTNCDKWMKDDALVIEGRQPLVGRLEIGHVRLRTTQKDVPMDMSVGASWFEGLGPFRIEITTEYGTTAMMFPIAIGSEGARQMRHQSL